MEHPVAASMLAQNAGKSLTGIPPHHWDSLAVSGRIPAAARTRATTASPARNVHGAARVNPRVGQATRCREQLRRPGPVPTSQATPCRRATSRNPDADRRVGMVSYASNAASARRNARTASGLDGLTPMVSRSWLLTRPPVYAPGSRSSGAGPTPTLPLSSPYPEGRGHPRRCRRDTRRRALSQAGANLTNKMVNTRCQASAWSWDEEN